MSRHITEEELRQQLEQEGFGIFPNHTSTSANEAKWIACRVIKKPDTPNCACNEKPPQIVVRPYFWLAKQTEVAFDLSAEAADGRWFELSMYSVHAEECVQMIEVAEAALIAAWIAAHDVTDSMLGERRANDE